MLAHAYFERTGDRKLLQELWPNLEAALAWIDDSGDRDKDGFVEYGRRNPNGLIQQGWKDSYDSVFHADESTANGPIALCEVQAYVYAAKRGAAGLARVVGSNKVAAGLEEAAATLKRRFGEKFWCEDIRCFALALDGEKKPCRVRASNTGHVLFTGIAEPEHARKVIEMLGGEASFSGWGIRTLASTEAPYNPMSYHNGSVWPHDNALIAYGLLEAADKSLATRVLTGLFDAAIQFELHRLPELFCGFSRRPGKAPTNYPVACSPQAWAAGAVFQVLQSCLGLVLKANEKRLYLIRPQLPASIPSVRIRNLRLGEALLTLELQRHDHTVSVDIVERHGPVEVVSVK